MKTLMHKTLFGALLASAGASAWAQQPSGQWDFTAGLAATAGQPLTYITPAAQQATSFNTTTAFGIPNIGGEVAQVMKTGSYAAGDGLAMPAPGAPNGGGAYVNDYTLIMDVLVPAESNAKARAILDSDLGQLNPDAEFFINADNGIGAKGQSAGSLPTNTWHRIAFVVDADDDPSLFSGTVRVYINGNEVGSRRVGSLKDDRFALAPNGVAHLFSDNDGETAPLYINSIQLRAAALSKGQIRALGGATAAGIPQTLPPVPSGIEKWIPHSSTASRTTRVGAVIAAGDTTIADSSISVSLNGTAQANPTITRDSGLITVATPVLNLNPGTEYTTIVRYTDSLAGARSFTNKFTAALFYEDFDSLVLGPGLEESHAADIGWTNMPPFGWAVDNTNMAGFNSLDEDGDGRRDGDGRSEWFGWAFANKDWWVRADDQRRSE
ncbi:MAG TPA: LamG-like jellyroll fold domain-containing protein, partial [Methylomirabilota bacterium]|nr:LamG-like jellyroll fold domain-containing protein [Methylomirabilota bacterium]